MWLVFSNRTDVDTDKKRRQRKTASKTRADVIKKAIQDLARDSYSSRAEKELLAKFLGKSLSAIDQFLYEGKGSVETYINVLLYRFALDEKSILHTLQNYKLERRREVPLKKSDRIWFELDESLTEDEKMYWLSLIRHAIRLRDQS